MTIHANQSQSEDRKFGGETLDPYENLDSGHHPSGRKRHRLTDDECELAEIERFFRSGWFGVLSKVDPEYLIKKLREGETKMTAKEYLSQAARWICG